MEQYANPSRAEYGTSVRIVFLPSCARHFFFLGWVAERFPGLVRQAASLGHELGCHSYWHRLIYRLSPEEFREDTKRAKARWRMPPELEFLATARQVFSLVKGTEWAEEILSELGFSYDSSVCPVNHDLYRNPDAPRVPHPIAGEHFGSSPWQRFRWVATTFPSAVGIYADIAIWVHALGIVTP